MTDAAKPKKLQMSRKGINTIVIDDANMITIDMQIDIDDEKTKDDEITLTQDQGGYERTIVLGSLKEFDIDWVRLEFPGAPNDGTYTLLHDPKEGLEPYVLFEKIPFDDLSLLTPVYEEPEAATGNSSED